MNRTKHRTAGELAAYLGAHVEGDANLPLRGVNSPEGAGPEDLIYVDAPKHLRRAGQSAARCALVAREAQLPGKTLLRTDNPKLAFARAAAWLLAPVRVAEGLHPTAVIAASARLAAGVAVGPYAVIEESVAIGEGTQIGAFCFLGRGSRVGEACVLHPRVTLYPGVRLGKRVVVHSGAVIGSDGFGYVFAGEGYEKFPQIGGIEIDDDVEIGANATLDRGSLGSTRIGTGTKLDNLVHVAHNVTIGEHTVIAAQTGISGSCTIGRRVVLGGQVGIADHCRLEDGCIVGAQAGVPTGKTIRSGQFVWGTPARPLETFKELHGLVARLPDLFARLKKIEAGLGR